MKPPSQNDRILTEKDQLRFLSKVSVGDDCWEWTDALSKEGYGYFSIGPRVARIYLRAHRVSYEMFVGPIPHGLELDHLCRNPGCVRPDHLEAVTHRENVLRGASPSALHAIKTHCSKGHPYDEENTYRYPNGKRQCRTCHRDRNRRLYYRGRESAGLSEQLALTDKAAAHLYRDMAGTPL